MTFKLRDPSHSLIPPKAEAIQSISQDQAWDCISIRKCLIFGKSTFNKPQCVHQHPLLSNQKSSKERLQGSPLGSTVVNFEEVCYLGRLLTSPLDFWFSSHGLVPFPCPYCSWWIFFFFFNCDILLLDFFKPP